MKTTFCAACLALLVCAAVTAQPYGADVFAAKVYIGPEVVRISPLGQVTTVYKGPAPANMLCMANDNRDLVLAIDFPPRLITVDPTNGTVTGTINTGAVRFIDYFNPTDDGNFVVMDNAGSIVLVNGDGSGSRLVREGVPFKTMQGVVYDVATGGYGAGSVNSTTPSIYAVAPDGTLTATYTLQGMAVYSLTQDHRDGAFIAGGGSWGHVHRAQRNGTVTTIKASTGSNCNAICFDRWSGNGEIVVGSDPVIRMDVNGVITTMHPMNFTIHSGMCFDRGRNLVIQKTGSPNIYRYDVDVPGQGLRDFVLGLSLSGFTPGIRIDRRVVQLTFDNVLLLSVQGRLAPFLTKNLGKLNAQGRNAGSPPVLDLSTFGTNVLKGMKVWAAVVTVDSSAPSNIGVISKPVVHVLAD